MGKKEEITKEIISDKKENSFQIRAKKLEGVALLTTPDNHNYLLLDSIDYWYDLIQNTYPSKKKCACKNEWFHVQNHYTFRNDSEDISHIQVHTICTKCGKKLVLMSIDIDYSPTSQLLSTPLTFCEKPNIKCKYKQYTSYWTPADLAKYLYFVHTELKLHIYGWYFEEGIRYCKELTIEEAAQREGKYLKLYFASHKISVPEFTKTIDEKGIYIKKDLWRKNEIIELSSINMMYKGRLFYTIFSEQYIDNKGMVQNKSDKFIACTRQLSDWLKENFITKRGSTTFDSPEMYNKIYRE